MRGILSKISGILVPILLCAALTLMAFLSTRTINELQGNARVINCISLVRGATQKLIKEELHQLPDDTLIERLNEILFGLSDGSEELSLIRLDNPEFQALLVEMKRDWAAIQEEIYRHRESNADQPLFDLSETYFVLADKAVKVAEDYTEEVVHRARNTLSLMSTAFVLLSGIAILFLIREEHRRSALINIENENKRKSERLSQCLQDLLVPMNEISELLYVADTTTYELLFVNELGKQTFHITDDNMGEKCYRVLQGLDAPCPFCTNDCLAAGETYTWEHTNAVTNKHYMLKDRLIEWSGRPARMELAFDITASNTEKEQLEQRLGRDSSLVSCIRELYRNHDFFQSSREILKRTGELFSAERAYIFLLHDHHLTNEVKWCADGITPQMEFLQNAPREEYDIWFNMLERRETILFEDVDAIRESMPREYALLSAQNIHNLIVIPLEENGQLNGLIGLDNLDFKLCQDAALFLQTLQYFITLSLDRSASEEALYRLSYLDKLTSFYNRNRYIQDLDELEAQKCPVGVVYLDVNGLKEINDRFGHDAGDTLLKTCAEIIQRSAGTERLYRIGGDEFVIICTGGDRRAFNDLGDLLKRNFADSTCRMAIGSHWTENSGNIQSIIKTADELMYTDKKQFYQTHHATNRYRHAANDLLQFLSDSDTLDELISQRRFPVYLQAKTDAESGRIIGAEALVRYQDEDGRIDSPDRFIPVLEEAHSISKIDYYVFEEVCRQLSQWREQGGPRLAVSSNFSRGTFMDERFMGMLEEISDRYQVDRDLLEIEITETMEPNDFHTLQTKIRAIRKAGFRVSVDDFGIKSSNLALLSTAEFDMLKIDRTFVQNISQSDSARMVVEMMAGVCGRLGIQLVAEGVETPEQLAAVRACGIDVVQGFLFSKPVPLSEFKK